MSNAMSRVTDEELDLYASTSTDDSIVSRLAREVVTLRAARTEADLLRAKVADLEARALTADEVRAVVRDAVLDRTACVAGWDGFLPGSIDRMADDIANRVANNLVGRVTTRHGGR